jgi:hypothetical protein
MEALSTQATLPEQREAISLSSVEANKHKKSKKHMDALSTQATLPEQPEANSLSPVEAKKRKKSKKRMEALLTEATLPDDPDLNDLPVKLKISKKIKEALSTEPTLQDDPDLNDSPVKLKKSNRRLDQLDSDDKSQSETPAAAALFSLGMSALTHLVGVCKDLQSLIGASELESNTKPHQTADSSTITCNHQTIFPPIDLGYTNYIRKDLEYAKRLLQNLSPLNEQWHALYARSDKLVPTYAKIWDHFCKLYNLYRFSIENFYLVEDCSEFSSDEADGSLYIQFAVVLFSCFPIVIKNTSSMIYPTMGILEHHDSVGTYGAFLLLRLLVSINSVKIDAAYERKLRYPCSSGARIANMILNAGSSKYSPKYSGNAGMNIAKLAQKWRIIKNMNTRQVVEFFGIPSSMYDQKMQEENRHTK